MKKQKLPAKDWTEMTRTEMRQAQKTKKILPKFFKGLLFFFLIFFLAALCYGAKLLADANNLLDASYRARDTSSGYKNVNPIKDPISVLIMGIDDNSERELGSARTDSIILLTMNPEKKQISTVSFPRDTYTKIKTENYKGMNRLNTAYTYGGNEGAIKTVEALIDVPITYYVTIDFQAFEQIIDALGGIELDVPFDINAEYAADNSGPTLIPEGRHTLTGEQALIFARIRKVDNDIERGKRQQEVIKAVIKKATDVGSIGKYSSVMKSLEGHLWTDMDAKTMLAIGKSGLNTQYKFASYVFDWESFSSPTEDGVMDIVALYEDSLNYISHRLRVSLGLDQPDERDEPEYTFETDGVISDKTPPPYGSISH